VGDRLVVNARKRALCPFHAGTGEGVSKRNEKRLGPGVSGPGAMSAFGAVPDWVSGFGARDAPKGWASPRAVARPPFRGDEDAFTGPA